MNLKTEMIGGRPANKDPSSKLNPWEHDAMYAHALVASIDEVGEMRYDANALSLGVQIFERADELMAEWLGRSPCDENTDTSITTKEPL